MKRYAIAEGELEVPDDWIDASTTTLVYDHPEGPVKLIAVRRAAAAGATIEDATRQQLTEYRRQLPQFELVHERMTTLAGVPASDVALRFRLSEGPVYHRMVSIVAGDRVLLLATQGPPAQSAAVDALFEQVTASAVFNHPEQS